MRLSVRVAAAAALLLLVHSATVSAVARYDWEGMALVETGAENNATNSTNSPYKFPRMDEGDSRRMFTSSQCTVCKNFITDVANAAIEHQLNKYDTVVEAQSRCQQDPDTVLLDLRCTVYDDMLDWLKQGKMLRESDKVDFVDLTLTRTSPESFCTRVQSCGTPETETPPNPHAAVMRMHLKLDLTALSRTSDRWTLFVRMFLHDIARVLSIAPARLEFHIHRGQEQYPEVVIKRYIASQDDSTEPLNKDTLAAFDADSLELGRRFRLLVASDAEQLNLPHRLSTAIDREWPVQVYALTQAAVVPAPVKK